MKKAISILSGLAMLMASCSTNRNLTVNNSLLMGTWVQPNVTLELKSNGRYHYLYKDGDYQYKQSGKYRYFADKDSVVLYGFYPQAYTPESKNERWTIRRLTTDSLTVYVHKSTVVVNGDTLNTAGNEIEIFTRKNDNK